MVPVLLGAGARLFDDLDGIADGCGAIEFFSSPSVVHVRMTRTPPDHHEGGAPTG